VYCRLVHATLEHAYCHRTRTKSAQQAAADNALLEDLASTVASWRTMEACAQQRAVTVRAQSAQAQSGGPVLEPAPPTHTLAQVQPGATLTVSGLGVNLVAAAVNTTPNTAVSNPPPSTNHINADPHQLTSVSLQLASDSVALAPVIWRAAGTELEQVQAGANINVISVNAALTSAPNPISSAAQSSTIAEHAATRPGPGRSRGRGQARAGGRSAGRAQGRVAPQVATLSCFDDTITGSVTHPQGHRHVGGAGRSRGGGKRCRKGKWGGRLAEPELINVGEDAHVQAQAASRSAGGVQGSIEEHERFPTVLASMASGFAAGEPLGPALQLQADNTSLAYDAAAGSAGAQPPALSGTSHLVQSFGALVNQIAVSTASMQADETNNTG
jgi:hypothetical protein